jgi:hypothetical protein
MPTHLFTSRWGRPPHGEPAEPCRVGVRSERPRRREKRAKRRRKPETADALVLVICSLSLPSLLVSLIILLYIARARPAAEGTLLPFLLRCLELQELGDPQVTDTCPCTCISPPLDMEAPTRTARTALPRQKRRVTEADLTIPSFDCLLGMSMQTFGVLRRIPQIVNFTRGRPESPRRR